MKKIIYWLLLSVFLLSLTGCLKNLKDLGDTQWDTTLSLPLLNKIYAATDLGNDSTLTVDQGILTFHGKGPLTSGGFDEALALSSKDSGNLPIPASTTLTGDLSISETGLHNNLLGQPTDIRIQYATISHCNLMFRVTKSTQLQQMTVTFANLHPAGQPSSPLTVTLNASNTSNFTQDYSLSLDNSTLGTAGNTNYIDALSMTITSVSSSSGTDQLRVWYDDPMYLESMTGSVQRLAAQIDDQTSNINIEYPSGLLDAIQLQSAGISLTINNAMGFPAMVTGELVAYGHGQVRHCNLKNESDPTHPYLVFNPDTGTDSQTITFSDSAAYLLGIEPDRIELQHAYFVIVPQDYNDESDGYVEGSLHADDVVTGDYDTFVPCVFTLNTTTLTPLELQEIEVSSNNQDNIRKHANAISVDVTVDNHFPVTTGMDLYFSTSPDSAITYTAHPELYPDVQFLRFTNNTYMEPNTDGVHYHFDVDSDQIDFFTNPTLYFGVKYHLVSSNGEVVTITDNSYARVTAHLTANLTMGKED